jgi:hypothetical protein
MVRVKPYTVRSTVCSGPYSPRHARLPGLADVQVGAGASTPTTRIRAALAARGTRSTAAVGITSEPPTAPFTRPSPTMIGLAARRAVASLALTALGAIMTLTGR